MSNYRITVEDADGSLYEITIQASSHEEASDKAALITEQLQRQTIEQLLVKVVSKVADNQH